MRELAEQLDFAHQLDGLMLPHHIHYKNGMDVSLDMKFPKMHLLDSTAGPLITTVLLAFVLAACGKDIREKVSERYSSGEKREVLKYKGEGTEEKLIERRRYSEDGELIRIEDPNKKDTLYYGDIKESMSEKKVFREFISEKSWKGDGALGDSYKYTEDSMFVFIDSGLNGSDDFSVSNIEYISGKRIVRYNKGEKDTLHFRVVHPDTIRLGSETGSFSEDNSVEFVRSDRDVRKSVRELRAAEAMKEKQSNMVEEEVTITPVGNQMRYGREEFTVPPNVSLRIVFDNTATAPSMQHNVVLVREPPRQAVLREIGQLGVQSGASQNYIPEDPSVLAATPIATPGEVMSATFTTPSEPGEYAYVCTYPGHWATENGVMKVISN